MDNTGQVIRRSLWIAEGELAKQAVKDENKIILCSPHLLLKETDGKLKVFSTKSDNPKILIHINRRFYKKTRSEYLVFKQGIPSSDTEMEQEEPEPHPRAIKLYVFQGVIYRKTRQKR